MLWECRCACLSALWIHKIGKQLFPFFQKATTGMLLVCIVLLLCTDIFVYSIYANEYYIRALFRLPGTEMDNCNQCLLAFSVRLSKNPEPKLICSRSLWGMHWCIYIYEYVCKRMEPRRPSISSEDFGKTWPPNPSRKNWVISYLRQYASIP